MPPGNLFLCLSWLVVANGAARSEPDSPPLPLSSFVPRLKACMTRAQTFASLASSPAVQYQQYAASTSPLSSSAWAN
ncbi:hypothetical protein J3F83DRAFT_756769 [Trichoderma novae-zelandiae]